uniref:Uncharacterized protein n=1 Tax=Avena sativa TaxID=4498 RepID=A0ACD5VGK4_AVESA
MCSVFSFDFFFLDLQTLRCFGQIAGGLCDNLLTCVVRAWDHDKPIFVAPAMNTFMWDSPFTRRHLDVIADLGVSLIPPVTKRLACGDYGNGAMAEPSEICRTVRQALLRNAR